MKKFDLELAKQGHPVQTRNGRPARIICWDRKSDVYPIVALIGEYDSIEGSEENTRNYSIHGELVHLGEESPLDLFMVSTDEAKVIADEVMKILDALGYEPTLTDKETHVDISFVNYSADDFPQRHRDMIKMLVKGYLLEFDYLLDKRHILLWKELQGQAPDSDRYSCVLSTIKSVPNDEPIHETEIFVCSPHNCCRVLPGQIVKSE